MTDPDLLRHIEAVIEAVTRDDVGAMVAGRWVGGNGGMLSRETIRAVDALRLKVNDLKRESEVMPSGN